MIRTLDTLVIRGSLSVIGLLLLIFPARGQEPMPFGPERETTDQRSKFDRVEKRLNRDMSLITDPAELSLALERSAQALVSSERLVRYQPDLQEEELLNPRETNREDAGLTNQHETSLSGLRERRFQETLGRYQQALSDLQGSEAAAERIPDSTLRDVRLRRTALTSLQMLDQIMRDVVPDSAYRKGKENEVILPSRPEGQRRSLLGLSRAVSTVAGRSATSIRQANFKSEVTSEVAQHQAVSSNQVARFLERAGKVNEFQMRQAGEEFRDELVSLTALSIASGVDGVDPAEIAGAAARFHDRTGEARRSLESERDILLSYADDTLMSSASLTEQIPISIWRDRTLIELVGSAANSDQFQRAGEIARMIPQMQPRAEAFIRMAEAQALGGHSEEATLNYEEAARAVASVPRTSPRQMLAAVLLDSLISVGRFEDARIAASLILDREFRLRALGAVARSMGERGLDEAALAWINTETAVGDRDRLRRNVTDGMKVYIENGRLVRSNDADVLSPRQYEQLDQDSSH
jgi:hypothetical protein